MQSSSPIQGVERITGMNQLGKRLYCRLHVFYALHESLLHFRSYNLRRLEVNGWPQ